VQPLNKVDHRGLSAVPRAKKNKETGEVFKKLLKEKEFSQYKLEQVTGLDKSVISKIATGQTANPTPTTLEKIAAALQIELGELTRIFAQSTVQSQHSATNLEPQESVSKIPRSNNSDFVGREDAIAHLNNLVNEGAKVILIHAEGGIGKTTLATKWFELQGLEYLDLRVGSTPQNLNSIEDWVRVTLRYHFKENPEQDFMTMMEQFKSKLQEQRIGVLIHHLEFALINGEFIESHNSNYIELLTVLAHQSVQSVTLITSCELLHEPDLMKLKTCQDYWLPELGHKAWRDYFVSRNITIDSDALYEINRAYGGNAFAMYLLSPEILNESQGNLKAYWQDNRDDLLRHPNLEKLVQRQLNKLQQDNPQAYKLLCRLGCYRYQYIPVISEKGVFCLLWDEQNERNKLRFIRDLKNRALVKFNCEGYYLYELIRQEAIERLKLTDDWKQSHATSGIFLSTLISENCKTIIPKITCTKVNDTQEQMYLNIENAEIAVKQELTKQENIALEVVYHFMEFYGAGCFEELRQEPNLLDNVFFSSYQKYGFGIY
jgi:transcriptional regulator with XRE-family HTH domain